MAPSLHPKELSQPISPALPRGYPFPSVFIGGQKKKRSSPPIHTDENKRLKGDPVLLCEVGEATEVQTRDGDCAVFPAAVVMKVEEFETEVRASLAFVSELRSKLAAGDYESGTGRDSLGAKSCTEAAVGESGLHPWLIFDEPRQPTTRP